MKIMSYVELTPAQEKTLDSLEKVVVRAAFNKSSIEATIRTFQQQNLILTMDADGVIEDVEVGFDHL